MALITDPTDLTGTEVTINTSLRTITLNLAGNLSADGVTLQALYSYLKEQWKTDNTKNPHPFPMVAITPEQFEFIYDWEPANNASRKLIRTAGWQEIDTEDGARLKKEFAGVISLGSFENETTDNAYYEVGTDATVDNTTGFTYNGPVNEPVLTYSQTVGPNANVDFIDGGGSNDQITRQDGGNFLTDGYVVGGSITVLNAGTAANDGTYTILDVTSSTIDIATGSIDTADTDDNTVLISLNQRSALKLFLRIRDADPFGKTYQTSTLADIGVTTTTSQAYRFPLSNATDLKVDETDANIAAQSPYTEIEVRYFDQAFSRDVDIATNRDFGIVIDVGTHSGVDGVSAGTTSFTSAEATIPGTIYDGGTLTLHDAGAPDKATHAVSTASGSTVTLSSALTNSETNLSFTLQRSSPVTANTVQIYEKVQYLLRQATDIDSTDQTVIGKTADDLLRFVGDIMEAGQATPANPNGGGTGVIIEGFDSNDTNSLVFYDNTATSRTYPFVAAGTISFNDNLQNDAGPASYWMFYTYTERFTRTDVSLGSASGNTATMTGSGTPDWTSELTDLDYINLQGWADANNNGIWQVTDASITSTVVDLTKVNGDTVSDESSGPSITIDKNPINSGDAILVKDNSTADITGTVSGPSVSFDYDYDNNVQGGRTAGGDAQVTIRAGGHDTAVYVDVTGTITQSTGISFSVVAGLERNYSNP